MESISVPVYRSVEIRPKIFMRADSTSSTTSLMSISSQGLEEEDGKRLFRAMKDISRNLQSLFQTKNESTICIGYCETEMETILLNFVHENDRILICVNGEIGRRAVIAASKLTDRVHTVEAYAGKTIDFDSIERKLCAHRPTILLIAHGENSTGVLQPIDGLGNLCEKYDCLLLVDAVDTLGAVKIQVDQWKIDVAYSTSQKALGTASGLVPLTLSSRALDKLKSRQKSIRIAHWDILSLVDAWNHYDESKYLYCEVIPSSVIYVLRENLNKIVDEGISNVHERHSMCAKRLQSALEKVIGLELFVESDRHRLPTIVTVKMPIGMNAKRFVKCLSERHLIEISAGVNERSEQIIRIGLTNNNANKKMVDNVVRAFYDTLKLMVPSYIDENLNINTYY